MSSSASGDSGARNVPGFRSPSGNIHCYYDPKAFAPPNGTKRLLTCGLRHADYAMQSWVRGPFTCTSRITGVTCRSRGRHGLFISRHSYRTW